jgi:two-component system NtrC family sensor kinase
VPLAFITGYSLVKYEQAIDQELSTRLLGNAREISSILGEFQNGLVEESKQISNDRALTYFLIANKIDQARDGLMRGFKGAFAHRISIFRSDGLLEIALYKDAKGEVQRSANIERMVELNKTLEDALKQKDNVYVVDFIREEKSSQMELPLFTKIRGAGGKVVGYMEEVIGIDEQALSSMRNRFNAEIFFYNEEKGTIVGTHEDLVLYKPDVFAPHLKDGAFFEMNIRQDPYRLMIREAKWGDTSFVMGLGVSKSAAAHVLKNVKMAFFTVVGAIVVLLILLSLIASRVLLKPIYEVLNALQEADFDKGVLEIPTTNETELGLLAEGFNDLSRRTFESQKALKRKIQELESANN